MTNEEWNTYFNGHRYFNGAKQDRHLAMFPEELPARLLKMFSFPGETVSDTFMGSCTTASAAKKSGRNSAGYEINPEFIPLIIEKMIILIEILKLLLLIYNCLVQKTNRVSAKVCR